MTLPTTPTRYQIQIRDKSQNLIYVLTKWAYNVVWEWNQVGGCGLCTMSIAQPFDFLQNFGPDYDVQIWTEDETGVTQLFYRGYAESQEPILQVNDVINLAFSGYSGQLKRVRINKTYTDMEVSLIVKDILNNFILPNTPITYNPVDIVATGFSVDSITFDDLADTVLQTLSDLGGNAEWGVDRFLNFFFKYPSSAITHNLRIGKDVVSSDPIYDYSTIINRIVIKGGKLISGATFETEVDNAESQISFGLRTSIVTNSAIKTDAVGQQYGTQLLAAVATIALRTTIQLVKIKTLYEVITPLGAFSLIIQPLAVAKLYGDPTAIYGTGWKYGGRASFQAVNIQYTILDEGMSVTITGGTLTPNIATKIKQLQYQLDQLRSSNG